MKNIIVAIHGIRTEKKYNWMRILRLHFHYDSRFNEWALEDGSYGWLEWFWCILPIVRYGRIRNFMRYLRKLQQDYPDANINIIAHSYGTMIAYEAIRRSIKDTRKEPIKINKLILIGGIVSSHEDFKDTIGEGLLKAVYNYCSYDDRVVRFNPTFGHCGYQGFFAPGKREHIEAPWPRVKNCRYTVTHSQWFDDEPPDFYQKWLDDLIGEVKDK